VTSAEALERQAGRARLKVLVFASWNFPHALEELFPLGDVSFVRRWRILARLVALVEATCEYSFGGLAVR
jgi:hypothetical protein